MEQSFDKSPRMIIDGLNCAAVTPEQMKRTLDGGVTAMNLTIVRPWAQFTDAMVGLSEHIAAIEAMADLAFIAESVADIERARSERKVAIIMGAQNSLLVEEDLRLLRILHRLGFRILQPTYNERNGFGDGATVEEDKGLTELGYAWVAEMNRLGILIDISHSGYQTCADVVSASAYPVIFSHANARALCDSPRNKPDELIRSVSDIGGVTGAVTWAPALRHAERPTIDDYLDQIEYIANLSGVEHVSFASDMGEGVYASAEDWDTKFGPNGMYPSVTGVLGDWYVFEQRFPNGYESLAHTSRIWDGLVQRGYSEDAVEKIMAGNLLRVFGEIWR
ncbi:MAG: membrane dipeptidase [Caldilineaceae bacterium]|nr:membrane dipeptidase [Caldilineaceae bacterium]